MILQNIKDRIGNFNGTIGIYYIDINTGERCFAGNSEIFYASGALKLLTLIETYRCFEEGSMSKDTIYKLKKNDYIKKNVLGARETMGALEYVHEGIGLTLEDLCKLSVSVSDNVACNILYRLHGAEKINRTLDSFGFKKTRVNRAIFDYKKVNQGLENYISVEEMAHLLYRMYKGQIVSNKASREMLEIMKKHQFNQIIPYYFKKSLPVAHQTGIDEEQLLDIGIVYSENPFILCMASKSDNTRNAESIMRDVTLMCYKNSNKSINTD